MKKRRVLLLVSSVLVLFLLAYFIFFPRSASHHHLSNIPDQAKWVGGADGGCWVEVVGVVSNSAFRLRIYRDNDGGLESDTIFVLNQQCSVVQIDSAALLPAITGYDGRDVHLRMPTGKEGCFLHPK